MFSSGRYPGCISGPFGQGGGNSNSVGSDTCLGGAVCKPVAFVRYEIWGNGVMTNSEYPTQDPLEVKMRGYYV